MIPKMHSKVTTYGLDTVTEPSGLPIGHIGIAVEQCVVLRQMNDGWKHVDEEKPWLGYEVTIGRFHSREVIINLQELSDIWTDTPENREEAIRLINQKRGDSPSNVHLVLYGSFKHPKRKRKGEIKQLYPVNQAEQKIGVPRKKIGPHNQSTT